MGRECHGSDASFPGRCRGSPGVTGDRVSGFPQRRVAGFRCVMNARAAWRSRDDANAPFPWPFSPRPPLGNHQLILRACGAVSLWLVCLFWAAFSDPPVREVIQCLSCPARPVSLSVRLSGSIHGAAKTAVSSVSCGRGTSPRVCDPRLHAVATDGLRRLPHLGRYSQCCNEHRACLSFSISFCFLRIQTQKRDGRTVWLFRGPSRRRSVAVAPAPPAAPPAVREGSLCSSPSTALVCRGIADGHSDGRVRCHLVVVSICISLVINDIEHGFLCQSLSSNLGLFLYAV